MPQKLLPGKSILDDREPPVVLLDLNHDEMLFRAIATEAAAANLRIVDLKITRGIIPPGIRPQGLLTNCFAKNPMVSDLLRQGACAVRIGAFPNPSDSAEAMPAVLPDMSAAGRLAAEHFAEREFKHLAFVGNAPWHEEPYLYNAFRDRAAELGCECHLLQLKSREDKTATWQEQLQYRLGQLRDWFEMLPKPVGVLTYNDKMAGIICIAAADRNLGVPEEVALLGVGNDMLACEFAPVALSSVDKNRAKIGRLAVHLLTRLMNGKAVAEPRFMVPPAGVVKRRSTDLLAVPDAIVARAMRYIWDHLDLAISVNDVARKVGVSRSVLDRRFRQHLKRGVNSELRRKRLETCARLLRATNLTIAEIAAACGFKSIAYLHRIFQESHGMTPRQYRQEGGGPRERE